MNFLRRTLGAGLPAAALAVILIAAAPAVAERTEPLPEALEGVGITERLEAPLPLDLVFTDENGEAVRLGDYFAADRPVILNLGYYACPMLCGLVLNGLVESLRPLEWTPGQEFAIVTVSIDPRESDRLARLKKQTYLEEYGRPSAASGWHFLTGDEAAIAALTEAVGFGFRWNEARQEWAHAAAIFVVTPEGLVSRYLYGIEYDTQTLRLSLSEASAGHIGSTVDRILLYCFHYDSSTGRYAPAAANLMRAGGLLTVIVLGGTLATWWRRDRRRRKEAT